METKREEHERLLKRTAALKEAHADLSLDRKPFNQAEHDAHNEDLAEHREDLEHHQERDDD
jgi:hypothetical protein